MSPYTTSVLLHLPCRCVPCIKKKRAWKYTVDVNIQTCTQNCSSPLTFFYYLMCWTGFCCCYYNLILQWELRAPLPANTYNFLWAYFTWASLGSQLQISTRAIFILHFCRMNFKNWERETATFRQWCKCSTQDIRQERSHLNIKNISNLIAAMMRRKGFSWCPEDFMALLATLAFYHCMPEWKSVKINSVFLFAWWWTGFKFARK